MATGRISTRIDEDLKEALEYVAEAEGKTASQIVRAALEEYCSKHAPVPSFCDAARRLGLIGCIKGGPTDVSTNKKWLQRFGERYR